MPNNRTAKLDSEFKRAIAEVLRTEVKDPRLSPMAAVTRVDVTPDLKFAKVYISVYDSDEKRASSIEALKSAEPFLRSKLNKRIKVRRLPVMEFVLDDSIEYGVRMSKLIDEVNADIKDEDEENNS